jgi:undecaprenyl-diphosphatase
MDALQAIVLGIVQGLTEFLPISSSAHLRIVSAFFGWDDPGAAYTAVTQIGTEAAVLIYFRKDLWEILSTWLRAWRDPSLRDDPHTKMGWFIIVATIPIGVIGFALKDQIENGARDLYLIGTTLIVFALVLHWADRRARLERETDDLSTRDGILIGLAQSLSLVPGVSRSGATMSAGLLLGLTREAAARFAFLIAVPAVLASGLFELLQIATGDTAGEESAGAIALSTVIAFVVGYAAIAWLLRYISTHTLTAFVIYRIALGALVLVLTGAGVIG